VTGVHVQDKGMYSSEACTVQYDDMTGIYVYSPTLASLILVLLQVHNLAPHRFPALFWTTDLSRASSESGTMTRNLRRAQLLTAAPGFGDDLVATGFDYWPG
jgi:hypothetical protein